MTSEIMEGIIQDIIDQSIDLKLYSLKLKNCDKNEDECDSVTPVEQVLLVDRCSDVEKSSNQTCSNESISESGNNKRTHEQLNLDENSNDSEVASSSSKREKVEKINDKDESVSMTALRRVVKKISREDLEELVARKVIEVISCHSEIGDLRSKCDKLEHMNESFKTTTKALQKMCKDLDTVVKRYASDIQNKKDKATPIIITRSVGLQVSSDQKFRFPLSGQGPSSLAREVIQQKTVKVHRPTPEVSKNGYNPKETSKMTNTIIQRNGNSIESVNSSTRLPNGSVESDDNSRPQKLKNSSCAVSQKNSQIQNRSTSPDIEILGMAPVNTLLNGINQMKGLPDGPTKNSNTACLSHPAQLPDMPNPQPHSASWKRLPPRPYLTLNNMQQGSIVLSWSFGSMLTNRYEPIASYQIYGYQETTSAPHARLWKQIGEVKALALPMACTLTQFKSGYKYHFAVRAQDIHRRVGNYSEPKSIALM